MCLLALVLSLPAACVAFVLVFMAAYEQCGWGSACTNDVDPSLRAEMILAIEVAVALFSGAVGLIVKGLRARWQAHHPTATCRPSI
jgi:hypothetical protein